MHSQRKHRRSTSTRFEGSTFTSTSIISLANTSTSLVNDTRGPDTHSGGARLLTTSFGTSSIGSSGAQGSSTFISTTDSAVITPSSSFIPTSTFTSSFQPSNPQPTSSNITSVSITTVSQTPETITLTSPSPEISSLQSPTSSSSSTPVPLSLTSTDGIIILSLSILAGILSLLCVFMLWRRCRRHDSSEALENRVDAVVFHQSGTLMSGRMESESTESMAFLTNLNVETASPSEIKSRLRECASPIHRHSHDSDHPSPPITPTHNLSRFSPAPDVFDSRWPGRLVPLHPSPRGSALTVENSQIIVSGDASVQSNISDYLGSGTQPITNPPSNLPLSEPENGQAVSGMSSVFPPDVLREKGELEARALQCEGSQPGGRTWDGPPPEESEKADSSKTGPPAYSPGVDTQSIPPVPVPLPLPPVGIRPLPVPSGGAGRRSSPGLGRRMPVRR